MSPTAIFNRFDLSASNGEHCGEYRVVYHKNYGTRLFLIFEIFGRGPTPQKGSMPVFEYGSESPSGAKLSPSLAKSLANGLDLTVSARQMSKADALVQLEKFFYKGLEHNGVKLPAVINFSFFSFFSFFSSLSFL
jgi:hypothetical protein